MEPNPSLFSAPFLTHLQDLITLHHSIYPRIPPQGIFFESLVAQVFKRSNWPAALVTLSKANAPQHDLLVGASKISLKTETGEGTRPNTISITKLCTTETGAWDSQALIRHTLAHLARYDHMLMLRAVWATGVVRYQVIEIPLDLLKSIASVQVEAVGRRSGRPSMATDVSRDGTRLFRIHYDGADGKCQIRGLAVNACRKLAEWDQLLDDS